MNGARVRVTIAEVPLIVQPAADELERLAPARRGERVRELPSGPDDRTAGRRRMEVVVDGWRFEALAEPALWAELRERAARAAAEHHTSRITVHAQIPGRVVRVWVADGEQVEQNQRLLAIEAMKMENEIRAPQAGTVHDIRVEVGGLVERRDELLSIS